MRERGKGKKRLALNPTLLLITGCVNFDKLFSFSALPFSCCKIEIIIGFN